MYCLDCWVWDQLLGAALVVLGPDDHDSQLELERDPFLGVAGQAPELAGGLLDVCVAGDFEIATTIVRAFPGLEHPRETQLSGCLFHGCQHGVALSNGHLLGDWQALGAQVVLLQVLVLDQTESPP